MNEQRAVIRCGVGVTLPVTHCSPPLECGKAFIATNPVINQYGKCHYGSQHMDFWFLS